MKPWELTVVFGRSANKGEHMLIKTAASIEDAEKLLEEGFEPIECSFGTSIIGSLQMDHHGDLSHLEGVAVRAYRDHFGARKDDPRFVVTGTADADATFAIAALAGLLQPPVEVDDCVDALGASEPPHKDLSMLACLINADDLDPFGTDLTASSPGTLVLLWKQLANPANDALAFYGGVDRWRALTTRDDLGALTLAAGIREIDRRAKVDAFPLEKISAQVAYYAAPTIDFGQLYRRAPVLIGYHSTDQKVRIGCRNKAVAEELFGAGGLKNVFPHLHPTFVDSPWSGREDVGGSPRLVKITQEEAHAAALQVAALVRA